jgi:hypothetical protein
MKPNLFIVGAPKCGTTAWVHYLASHPDIFFPEVKEPHYFSFDRPPDRRLSWEEYQELYRYADGKTVVGDASVGYLGSTVAANAIHEFNPDAKVVIFLREQEHYLPSWHNQLLFNGGENIADFETAWRLSGRRDATNSSKQCWNPAKVLDYKTTGFFGEKIDRYLSLFGRDQVRILHFRDWVKDPRPTYVGLLDFLGLRDDLRIHFPPVNEARHRSTNFFLHLVRNPSPFVRVAVRAARNLTGRKGLGLGKWAFSLGTRKGYAGAIGRELREEIRAFYEADNRQLEPLIWRPSAR